MEARLASRRFYLACAPTSSHKSTLPSPVYPPSSTVSFPPTPRFLLIGRLDCIHEAFSLPLAIMQPLHCPAVSNFPPFMNRRRRSCAVPLGSPCPCLLSPIFSEHLRPYQFRSLNFPRLSRRRAVFTESPILRMRTSYSHSQYSHFLWFLPFRSQRPLP
jgi:hypothetical protein